MGYRVAPQSIRYSGYRILPKDSLQTTSKRFANLTIITSQLRYVRQRAVV